MLEYLSDENRRRAVLVAGIYLIPFAGTAFIRFTVSLRMWLSGSVRRLTPLLANLLLVCGIIYVALLFAAGASMSVLAVTAEVGSGKEAALAFGHFPEYGTALLLVFAMRMCAMIVFALSNIGRTYRVLSRWFAYLGFLLNLGQYGGSVHSYDISADELAAIQKEVNRVSGS